MSKYLVSVSYDGSKFHGWAKQPNQFTVQGFIEKKISSVFSCKVSLLSSSRTDAGVHAIDQNFTFSLNSITIDNLKMKVILEKSLKDFVYINSVRIVDENFNLRKEVVLKEYRYLISLKNYSIFSRNYFFDAVSENIDVGLFRKILQKFEGKHDFFNFCFIREKDRLKFDTVREIKKIEVEKIDESILCVKFFSKGFLRYQVRAILGECLDKHKKTNGDSVLMSMINCKEILKYKKIAPPSGLYLWNVSFRESIIDNG